MPSESIHSKYMVSCLSCVLFHKVFKSPSSLSQEQVVLQSFSLKLTRNINPWELQELSELLKAGKDIFQYTLYHAIIIGREKRAVNAKDLQLVNNLKNSTTNWASH